MIMSIVDEEIEMMKQATVAKLAEEECKVAAKAKLAAQALAAKKAKSWAGVKFSMEMPGLESGGANRARWWLVKRRRR